MEPYWKKATPAPHIKLNVPKNPELVLRGSLLDGMGEDDVGTVKTALSALSKLIPLGADIHGVENALRSLMLEIHETRRTVPKTTLTLDYIIELVRQVEAEDYTLDFLVMDAVTFNEFIAIEGIYKHFEPYTQQSLLKLGRYGVFLGSYVIVDSAYKGLNFFGNNDEGLVGPITVE